MPKENPERSENNSPLALALKEQIADAGAIPLAVFMEAAASHYYAAHEPFGVEGDFTTAPEISQMFGEMIGAWLTDLWLQAGKPDAVKLIELGPGRGTLSADIMRTVSNWPEFSAAITLHLVETSPSLRQKQAATLKDIHPTWYDTLSDVPDGFSFIIANEFFDALPIHQFEKTSEGWMERYVTLRDEKFVFTLEPPAFDIADVMPPEFTAAKAGAVFEISPVSLSIAQEIAMRIEKSGGTALFIDYGHAQSGLGDTLQALKNHTYSDALQNPGDKDITAHVDFGTLSSVVSAHAQVHGAVTQGQFLTSLGIMQRADALRQTASDAQRRDIDSALTRLTAPSEMGSLFKVMALTPLDSTIVPLGFGKDEILHD